MAKEIEGKIKLKWNTLQNTYAHMQVLKAATPEELAQTISEINHPILIKAMYWSPSDEKHVAYVLSQTPLNEN